MNPPETSEEKEQKVFGKPEAEAESVEVLGQNELNEKVAKRLSEIIQEGARNLIGLVDARLCPIRIAEFEGRLRAICENYMSAPKITRLEHSIMARDDVREASESKEHGTP